MKTFNTSVRQWDQLLLMHRQELWAVSPASRSTSWIIITESRSGLLCFPDPDYYQTHIGPDSWIITTESRSSIFYLYFFFAKINSFLTGRPYTVISRTLQSSYCRRLLVVNNSLSKGKNKIWRHHWLSAVFLSSLFLSSPWSHCIRNEFQKKSKIRCKKNKKDKTKNHKTKKKKKDRLTINTNKH